MYPYYIVNFNIQHRASHSLFVSAIIAEIKLKVAELGLYLVIVYCQN